MTTPQQTVLTPEATVQAIAEYASDRKAVDLIVLDRRELISYTDFFLIATGRSDRQVKAIHDAIHEQMKHDHGMLPARTEGTGASDWILLDYGDVVVHIFTPEMREYYRLETLWGEAPTLPVALPEPEPA